LTADELIALVIPIYERHFTHAEVKELIEFYQSPLGQKMLAKMPLVSTECIEAGAEWGRKIGARIENEHARKNRARVVIEQKPQPAAIASGDRRAQIIQELRAKGLNPEDYDIDATLKGEQERAQEGAAYAKLPKAHYMITVGQGAGSETYFSEKEPKRLGNAYKIKDVRGLELEVSGTVKIMKLPN
jgi:hypothetical protein